MYDNSSETQILTKSNVGATRVNKSVEFPNIVDFPITNSKCFISYLDKIFKFEQYTFSRMKWRVTRGVCLVLAHLVTSSFRKVKVLVNTLVPDIN